MRAKRKLLYASRLRINHFFLAFLAPYLYYLILLISGKELGVK